MLKIKIKKRTNENKRLIRGGQSPMGCGWCGHNKPL